MHRGLHGIRYVMQLQIQEDRSICDLLDLLDTVRAKAKAAGLWCPQLPKAIGGQGLPVVGMAACYEEMNYSIFGPVVFNCAAPDDGNMTVLSKVATRPPDGITEPGSTTRYSMRPATGARSVMSSSMPAAM